MHAEASMYLYDNWARFRNPVTRTWKTSLLVTSNIAIIVIGSFLIVGGTYGSVLSIRDSYAQAGGRPWSCADNSN